MPKPKRISKQLYPKKLLINMTKTEISFKVSYEDRSLIQQIAERAVDFSKMIHLDTMTTCMDLTACHANGNKLDLARLLAADDFNFGHDIFGIRRHIDRSTGQLANCFVPRFSARYSK